MDKIAWFYDRVENEYMDFCIKDDSQIEEILNEYNSIGCYDLRFEKLVF